MLYLHLCLSLSLPLFLSLSLYIYACFKYLTFSTFPDILFISFLFTELFAALY
ncbi:unnamed protein product [Brugia timori]|uniref:Uncharacterized protein n=1 Tax=Brugia timori TaxID=42155 RepID=A0A3P7Z860_9BILA|nr:unnamed protein product [Brugia timori]